MFIVIRPPPHLIDSVAERRAVHIRARQLLSQRAHRSERAEARASESFWDLWLLVFIWKSVESVHIDVLVVRCALDSGPAGWLTYADAKCGRQHGSRVLRRSRVEMVSGGVFVFVFVLLNYLGMARVSVSDEY